MAIEKKKYVDSAALQHLLEKLRDKNAALFLEKTAEAASAAKVKNALTLTVGDTDVAFDGSEAKSAAVAAKVHNHTHADISDFDAAVKKAAFGDETATMTAHTHDNKAVLDTVSADRVGKWDAKISVDDVAKIKYENTGMTSVKDVKGALDVLVANVQIAAGQLTETSRNMDAVKRVADDAAKAAAAEKTRAEGKEGELKTAIDAINNAETGILKQAKNYADGKDAAIEAAKSAADAAQAAVATEKGRAEGVEQGLRADLGNKTDEAAAEGSAFARIKQVKADLASEITRAKAAEKEAKDAAVAAQGDVDALEAKVGEVPADKTVVQMIAEAKTEATYDDTALKGRVKAIEDDYLKAADKTELQGNIDTVSGVANAAKNKIDAFMLAADVKEGAVDTLKEIQDYITSDGTAAQKMTQDIAANAQAIKDEADRAKAAEKANADDIVILKGADTVEGSVAKAVKDAKDAVMTEVNKKVAQSDYNAKVAELEAADTALDSRLDALESGDNSVAAQVKVVADDLKAHKAAQATKEAQVDGKLAVIQGEANVEGSIKKTLADAKAYADAEDKKIEDLLGTKKDAAAVDTAFGRIAKEVARATAAEEALDGRLDTAEGKITALETTVGNAESGLVKDVADLKAIDADTRLTAAETSIDTLEAWVAAHGTITNAELDEMLNAVYGTQA